MNAAETPAAKTCTSCGVELTGVLTECFDCGMLGRPFERNGRCKVCGPAPLVRLYLSGVFCDAHRPNKPLPMEMK